MRKSNYDKYPATRVDGIAIQGWNEIISTLEKGMGEPSHLGYRPHTSLQFINLPNEIIYEKPSSYTRHVLFLCHGIC